MAWAVVRVGVLGLGLGSAGPEGAAPPVLDAGTLSRTFSDFQRRCAADGQRLWGQSLCGPLLVVDPETRAFLASERPGPSTQRSGAGPWVGVLPKEVNIANTAVSWAGVTWVQLRAPLPDSPERRDALLAHESFHRTQVALGRQGPQEGGNAHLDEAEGRVLLQLEWRALAAALQTAKPVERRAAIEDALVFRAARRARFPAAATEEGALERHEGLAEDTGLAVAARDASSRRRLVLENLADGARRSSFVRAFAYASGPAYGALLDESPAKKTWRAAAIEAEDLGVLLARAHRLTGAPGSDEATVEARAKRYDGQALREAEAERERAARARAERLRRQLVEGPVLRLALRHMRIQFNPGELVPLAGHGTVYPGARLVDDWGSLEASGEVLVSPDWSTATVVAPPAAEGSRLQGAGWALDLAPGWRVRPGERAGDFVLQAPAPAP
ncbi:hypothetical protein LY474_34310 [Myxococcus stipitatus]|uniref:hypothetical protein n=1 Tax=Myxococcus stipitatus TaxID=83455 RepID=UPI001F2072A1|nr:hypothetical protein [Myxococcus stipitatus]MCE9672892.1 hypothetical protein [Myxococcus stipitatus]